MDYHQGYKTLLKLGAGKDIEELGWPEDHIRKAEGQLKIRFPRSLRTLYLSCGKEACLTEEHNRIYDPANVYWDGDFLVFAEENQCVVIWSIHRNCDEDDPEVFQRQPDAASGWQKESWRLFEFIVEMAAFMWGMSNSRKRAVLDSVKPGDEGRR